MIKFVLAVAMIFGVSIAHAGKFDNKRKPASFDGGVKVGGSEEVSSCGYGVVLATTTLFGLKAGKMTFEKVDVNTMVSACDFADEGNYVGVIYGKKGQDCKINGTESRQEYKGPCKSGWIKKEFFELLAG